MAEKKHENQCAHPGCNCPVPKGEKYCSPHCEAMMDELMCGCGHAGCQTRVAAQRA